MGLPKKIGDILKDFLPAKTYGGFNLQVQHPQG